MTRDWTAARRKVDTEARCRVCGRSNVKLDAAHVVPRSRVSASAGGPGEHPDNIVPLCHEPCHAAYDAHRLDLLPYLTLAEQAYATGLVGLAEAYRRTTNERSVAA
jgi:5-methylcytosine-specific restriction endonuclease McrA